MAEMLIAQKRTCHGCIAYRDIRGHGPCPTTCPLGYRIENLAFDSHGFTQKGYPREACPKPRNIKDYLYAQKWYRRQVIHPQQKKT